MADADRNLLFGLIALQVGLIDQAQLVAAFQAWARDKTRPLAEHLATRGDLDGDDRAAVEAMVARHLKKHGGDTEKSLASIPAGPSTRESLAAAAGPDVEGTLAHLDSDRGSGVTEPASDRTTTFATGTATSEGQRFRILRPHARGGLGAVFVALDQELNREVALKQILDRHADDPVSRQRFVMEAEITGGLEHPGIVPVYGLGTDSDGRPYYAMRFVRGDSLKEAIAAFHGDAARKSSPGARSLALRTLLRRFTDVCNAVDYAHSRGILHRDLKPANIIVGKHGETLVVDWGLAKPVGRVDGRAAAGERTLVPSSTSGSSETLPGSAMGTPAYMSPEQAAGDLDRLGPRTDVYSLGATLYCLLTGKPPLEGDDVGEMLKKVQKGDFPRPRQLDPAIDKALEAVCLKAMSVKPEDRYASARALADDLDRWMADEPVKAWREPWSRALLRWLSRHRVGVTAAGAAGLVALAGLAGVLAVQAQANRQLSDKNGELTRANHRAEQANAELAAAKTQVEARYDLAMEAIRTFHTGVSQDFLLKEPQFQDLRDRLLKAAGDFYGRLGKLLEGQSDRASWRAIGQANFELAALTNQVGRKDAALAAHRQVLAYREGLVREPDADAEDRADLGRSLIEVGRLLEESGQSDDALETLARVRPLAQDPTNPPALQAVLATSLYWTGATLRHKGRPDEARKTYEEVQAIRRALAKRDPRDIETRRQLSWCANDLGNILYAAEKPAEARAAYEEARRLKEALAEEYPDVLEYRRDVTVAIHNVGNALSKMGDSTGALREFQKAQSMARALSDAQPAVTQFRRDLAGSEASIGWLMGDTGDPIRALEQYRKATANLRALANAQPSDMEIRGLEAGCENGVGWLLFQMGQPSQALERFERSRALWQQLSESEPANTDYQNSLANLDVNQAAALLAAGRPDEARAPIERALAAREALVAASPANATYAFGLAESLLWAGQLRLARGNVAGAAADWRRACALYASHPHLGGEPKVCEACCHAQLAGLAGRAGSGVSAEQGPAEADRAMAALRRALVGGYRPLDWLRHESALEPLRDRPDFQRLLLDLAMPPDPFARSE